MASPLDAIARAVATGFKGKLRSGTLRRVPNAPGVDSYGDANPGSPVTYPFEGIRETYSAVFKARAGIPQTDVRILVIAGSCATDPRRGDQVYIEGRWHQVREIENIDPATATYALQSFEIKDPTS